MRKLLFVALLTVAAAAPSEKIEIDWSKVKPVAYYREFWEGKAVQPPAGYFKDISKFVSSGMLAGRNDFPFNVALLPEFSYGPGLCGASLISRWAVLTAASCIDGSLSTVIVLGGTNLENPNEPLQVRFRVQETNYRIHPLYRPGVTNSDIAVIRFNFAIARFHEGISPVDLPATADNLFANQRAFGMGFGSISNAITTPSNILRFVEVTTMTNTGLLSCSWNFPGRIDSSHICTSGVFIGIGNVGVCPGDMGGPLVVDTGNGYLQIGVASPFFEGGCNSGQPSVFTRVSSFINWIQQHM